MPSLKLGFEGDSLCGSAKPDGKKKNFAPVFLTVGLLVAYRCCVLGPEYERPAAPMDFVATVGELHSSSQYAPIGP
jgi:hypothetical protein